MSRFITKGAYICRRGVQTPWLHPIKTYVGDKAGTEVDALGLAATHAIQGGFHKYGIAVTTKQVRQPMGGAKAAHVEAIRSSPEVNQQFMSKYGDKAPSAADVYNNIVPTQLEILKNPKYGRLLPGVASSMEYLKRHRIDRTATTGYTRSMVDLVLKDQERQGYIPDVTVASNEVARGRPWPFGIWRCMLKSGNGYASSVIKVDDTKEGALEGLAAGCPTVVTIKHGNFMGNYFDSVESLAEMESKQPRQFQDVLNMVRDEVRELNPHFIIDTMESLPAVIEYIAAEASRNVGTSTMDHLPCELPFGAILRYIMTCMQGLPDLLSMRSSGNTYLTDLTDLINYWWPDVEPFVYLPEASVASVTSVTSVTNQADQIYCALEFIKMVDEELQISVSGNLPNLEFLKLVKCALLHFNADQFVTMATAYLASDAVKVLEVFKKSGIVLP